jgi:hypothetical protein
VDAYHADHSVRGEKEHPGHARHDEQIAQEESHVHHQPEDNHTTLACINENALMR